MSVISDKTGNPAIIPPPVRTVALLPENPSHSTPQQNGALISPPADDYLSKQADTSFMNALNDQRNDIARIEAASARLNEDMQSFRDFMVKCREDLGKLHVMHKEREQEQATYTSRLDEVESRDANEKSLERAGDPSIGEFELLTNDIMKVSQKANEVDALKMEVRFLKLRLKLLEDKYEGPVITSYPQRTETPNEASTRDPITLQTSHSIMQSSTQSPTTSRPGSRHVLARCPAIPDLDQPQASDLDTQYGELAATESTDKIWRYIGPPTQASLHGVFPKFGIKYNKYGIKAGIDKLERHVNDTAQWSTEAGQTYGELILPNVKRPCKRKYDEAEDMEEKDAFQASSPRSFRSKRSRLSGTLSDVEHSRTRNRYSLQHLHFSAQEPSPEIASSERAISPSPILGRYDDNGHVMPGIEENDVLMQHESDGRDHSAQTDARRAMPPPPLPRTPVGIVNHAHWGPYSNPEKRSESVTNLNDNRRRHSLRSRDSLDRLDTQIHNENAADDNDARDAAPWLDPTKLVHRMGEKRAGWYGPDGRLRTKDGYMWGSWKSAKLGGKHATPNSRSIRVGADEADAVMPSIETAYNEDEEVKEARRRISDAREQLVRATLEREHLGIY